MTFRILLVFCFVLLTLQTFGKINSFSQCKSRFSQAIQFIPKQNESCGNAIYHGLNVEQGETIKESQGRMPLLPFGLV